MNESVYGRREPGADPSFMIEAQGPAGLTAVFEDDGESGRFYLYEIGSARIVSEIHVYDRSRELEANEKNVRMAWASDQSRCTVWVGNRIGGVLEVHGTTRPG